jgi:hypothetical protein
VNVKIKISKINYVYHDSEFYDGFDDDSNGINIDE